MRRLPAHMIAGACRHDALVFRRRFCCPPMPCQKRCHRFPSAFRSVPPSCLHAKRTARRPPFPPIDAAAASGPRQRYEWSACSHSAHAGSSFLSSYWRAPAKDMYCAPPTARKSQRAPRLGERSKMLAASLVAKRSVRRCLADRCARAIRCSARSATTSATRAIETTTINTT